MTSASKDSLKPLSVKVRACEEKADALESAKEGNGLDGAAWRWTQRIFGFRFSFFFVLFFGIFDVFWALGFSFFLVVFGIFDVFWTLGSRAEGG